MLSPTPDSLSGGYAPSEPARPKSANRQHASGERSSSGTYSLRSITVVIGPVSADTIDAAAQAHAAYTSVVDLSSPETRDAAAAVHATPAALIVVVGTGGFDWTDAGIGAAGGFAVAILGLGAGSADPWHEEGDKPGRGRPC